MNFKGLIQSFVSTLCTKPEWDPNTTMFAEQEEAMLVSSGNLHDDSLLRAGWWSKMVAAVYF